MRDTNTVILIGRATKDAALSYAGQTAKLEVSLAVNSSRKVNDTWQDEVSYFDVVIFGKSAENLKPLITKGKQLAVNGSLKQDRWEKDGQKKSKVYILADYLQLLGSKTDNGNAPTFTQNAAPAADNGIQEDIPF